MGAKLIKNENGHIVVETTGSFILFVLLIVSILSLVNIVTIQARVHYALTQAAQFLSINSYILEVTGLADELGHISNEAGRARAQISSISTDIDALIDGVKSLDINIAQEHGGSLLGRAGGIMDDPGGALDLIIGFVKGEAVDALFAQMLGPLVGRYLHNGNMSADEYLRLFNVIDGLDGLNFYNFNLSGNNNSVLIDEDGNVRLVVNYEVMYVFGALPLPFATLKITQTATTRAWLGGSGEGYKP